jgi:hypothetical protein
MAIGMSLHRRIAAWLHVAVAAFIVGATGMLWICAAMLAPTFEGSFVPDLVAMFGRPIAVALIAFGTLEAAAAIAVLRGREWGRVALVMISALQLVVFPIGTAVALYTGWALILSDRSRVAIETIKAS